MTTRPEPKAPDRYDVEHWIERSQLPRLCCEILHFFCRRMAQGTIWIPPEGARSLTKMAAMMKVSRRHIQRGLNYLEELDLIVRHRPTKHDQRVNHARTTYSVVWPNLQKLGTAVPQPPRAIKSQGLGTGIPKARDKGSQELGPSSPEPRDTEAPKQTLSDQADHADPELGLIIGLLKVRTGITVTEEWAAKTRQLLLARPGADKNPAAYIRRVLSTDPNPGRFLPTPVPPPYKPHQQEEAS